MRIAENNENCFSVLDTAGQEEFSAMGEGYMRSGEGIGLYNSNVPDMHAH